MANPSFKNKHQNSSVIWNFVIVNPEDDSTALCQIKNHESCSGLLSRGGKNKRNHTTSNIFSHLRTYHLQELNVALAKKKGETGINGTAAK